MKKIILSILVFIVFGINQGMTVFAQDNENIVKVETTEKIPGAGCVCAIKGEDGKARPATGLNECKESQITKKLYICNVQKGFAGTTNLFKGIVAVIIQIAVLSGVLAIAALGVAWSVSGGDDPEYKKKLKEWIIGVIVGLAILFLFKYILLGLAPWAYS